MTYDGTSGGTYRGYDAIGRVARQIQQTDYLNYLVEASYNASTITSQTYPNVPSAISEESHGDTEHAAAMRDEAREIFARLGMDTEIGRMEL